MAETSVVVITPNSKPLFLAFCRIHGLQNGDTYSDEAYVAWSGGLTVAECTEIYNRHDRRPGRVLPESVLRMGGVV